MGCDAWNGVFTLGRNSMFGHKSTAGSVMAMYGSVKHSAWSSEALRADVIASRNTVFHVRNLKDAVFRGSNGNLFRALSTICRSHAGISTLENPLVLVRPATQLRTIGLALNGKSSIWTCLLEIAVT